MKLIMKMNKTAGAVILLAVLSAVSVLSSCTGRDRVTEVQSFAMDTITSIKLYGGSSPDDTAAMLDSLILETENTISRHKEDSVISRLNRGETVNADCFPEGLLEKNLQVREVSGGLFDPFMGSLIDLWGIGTERECVPDEGEIREALQRTGASGLIFENGRISPEPGTVIDLGASGKGLVLDRLREALSGTDVHGAVVSAGGSILLYGTHDGKQDFRVAIKAPDGGPSDYIGFLTLHDTCVSTSGDYERYFTENGKRYHHILSPETGFPAETGLRSVTVICADGVLSDVLSTAVFLSGREEGLKLLQKFDAEGVVVSDDGTVTVTAGIANAFQPEQKECTVEVYEGFSEDR